MATSGKARWRRALGAELAWFIRLRWIAGLLVVIGSFVEWKWLGWYGTAGWMAGVGAAVLAYNVLLSQLLPRLSGGNGAAMVAVAWIQLLLDLACLTILTILTGALSSPLLGFYVFHMVFASVLLPRRMGYPAGIAAVLMLVAGLWASGRWPAGRQEATILLGWVVTMLMIVRLTNRIIRDLRVQRRRLVRQNSRIRRMSRKLQLQQQGMIQQEKMAAAGQMAAGVAHEIANPLASMDGLLQLMERKPDKLRPEAIGTLREQVSRISQIVRRMTTFAHPGDGEWRIESLNDVVARTLEVLRFDPRMRRVEVDRQLAADLPPIRIIPDAIQQVITNLVSNAMDAMEGAANPKLSVRTRAADGGCVLEVADNGHGIAPKHIKHLFEPFFTTKPIGKGTGLGLSITYSLVRTHGGIIEVDSQPGAGSRFNIFLPARAEARRTAQSPAASGGGQ